MSKIQDLIPWQKNFIYNIREQEWERYKERKASRLKNKDFTIIASSCNGAVMYHDLGLPYLSPTINLFIDEHDFIKMVENLKWYMDGPLVESGREESYPIGRLRDIEIHFMHYKTFAEAAGKWEERKKRMNWDNLFIVGVSSDGDPEIIRRFEQLPYKNKVIFSPVEYPEYRSVFWMRRFKNSWRTMTGFQWRLLKRRHLDEFDYVAFLNGEEWDNR